MAGILALPPRQAGDLAEESAGGGLATVRRLRRGGPESADQESPRAGSLAEIRSTGLIRPASAPAEPADVERVLPVLAPLARLLPDGGLRRGSTVAVARGDVGGATSLLLTLLAEASAAGSWCAVVGLPDLGLVAAHEAGVELSRLALIASPGPDWVSVVAALLDGVDIVVAAAPARDAGRGAAGAVAASVAGRLAARARQRGSVLVPYGEWTGVDLTLEVTGAAWHGLEQGRGRLRRQELEIVAYGRGAAARTRRTNLTLPALPSGGAGLTLPAVPSGGAAAPDDTIAALPFGGAPAAVALAG